MFVFSRALVVAGVFVVARALLGDSYGIFRCF